MSAHIETIITCDGNLSGKGNPGFHMGPKREGPFCEGNDGSADMRELPAVEQRRKLREQGWHQQGSRDFCPECWAARRKK